MKNLSTNQISRQPVLVVVNHDGFIEVYANRNAVNCHIAVKPEAVGADEEQLAEDVIELEMPRRYRELYWPGNQVAVGQVRKRTPEKIAEFEYQKEMFHTLSNVGPQTKWEVKEWQI